MICMSLARLPCLGCKDLGHGEIQRKRYILGNSMESSLQCASTKDVQECLEKLESYMPHLIQTLDNFSHI
jgi:hypothetical protein